MKTEVSEDILKLPMRQRAEMAMKEAVAQVIEDHIRMNLPISVLRDGKVVELSADDLRAKRDLSRPSTPLL